jgi:ATP-dependent DNA helicase DinG
MSKFILNFPGGYQPRDKQAYALKRIEEAFESGRKFVIVHASTGSGKTHCAKTLGNISKQTPQSFSKIVDDYSVFGENGADLMSDIPSFGTYALTITKALQDQYQNTFDDTGLLKGQSNYQCDVEQELTVDTAPCIYVKGLKQQCWGACRCPYYNQRNEMLKSQFASLNYSMFFSLPEHLQRREIIVCDEGSELEEQLVSQFTCEVDFPFLMKVGVMMRSFPTQETPTKVGEWLKKLSTSVEKSLESLKDWMAESSNKKDHIDFTKKKNDYSKLNNFNNSLTTLINTFFDSEYIIEHVDKVIRFIPLKVNKLSKYLFDRADKVVILSATIIDPPSYCNTLGITDYEYIHVESDFDPKKSPIHIMVNQKLNFQNLKSMLPKLRDQIEGILDLHKDDKGIVHTHTQYLADYLRNNIKSNRLLCREAGIRNEELLEIHESSDEPTVLVSPSMTYGVDLKGDLGKFQILMKAPWLPTKDVRVEKLMKIDKNWYSNAMLKTLVQACGRGVRSEDDECETYILDGGVYDAIIRNKNKLPKYFLDRIQ